MIGSLGDFIAMKENGITDFTKDGRCSGCGECCSDFLPVSKEEVNRIHRYIKEHGVKAYHKNVLVQGFDITCPFRNDKTKTCMIYSVRPAICKEFQCNYPATRIAYNKSFFNQHYDIVSMREEFFGDNKNIRLFFGMAIKEGCR